MKNAFAAVILAAGQGKRMHSNLPKVLHPLGGRPLICWVVDAARAAGAEKIVAVLGAGRELVIPHLPPGVETAVQEEQLGTGHAARCAEQALRSYPGPIAVLCGDVPLLTAETVKTLVARQAETGAALVVLSARIAGPHAYGRIVRDAAGDVLRIVEHKDATDAERRIAEINTGTYAFGPGQLFPALAALRNENAQREYYLTDTVAWHVQAGHRVLAVVAPRAEECLGINSPEDLAQAERVLIE